MAVHAGFRRRDAGKRAGFHRRVAIAAVDAVIADMMLMTEWDWLDTGDADLGHVRRFIDRGQTRYEPDEEEDSSKNTDFRNRVGAGVKYLGHSGHRGRKLTEGWTTARLHPPIRQAGAPKGARDGESIIACSDNDAGNSRRDSVLWLVRIIRVSMRLFEQLDPAPDIVRIDSKERADVFKRENALAVL